MNQLILASSSPRRREILELAGLSFRVIHPECEEAVEESDPARLVLELSRRKCLAGAKMLRNGMKYEFEKDYVLGADTIVFYEGKVLGKPRDSEDAFSMLESLAGKTHSVYTGVTIYDMSADREESFYERTEVTFYNVDEEEIRAYIASGDPMDKAGAYGIQGRGAFLVKEIHGDYFNVVGLPVARLIRLLREKTEYFKTKI